MLFVESKFSNQRVVGAMRTALLGRLQERGLTPLIRSTRLGCYELALHGSDHTKEMVQAVAAWTEAKGEISYTNGDVFCFEDYTLFLIFGDASDERALMRAGIVYEADTTDPARKLDDFCRNITSALQMSGENNSPVVTLEGEGFAEWHVSGEEENGAVAFNRFAASARQTSESGQIAGRAEVRDDQARAIELLNDAEARRTLRRIREKHAEGRAYELLASRNAADIAYGSILNSLREAGLLKSEVLVSCRKNERALFRLPSMDALAGIMASNATCSECGTAIADEEVEELIAPTQLSNTLLEDGLWLVNHLRAVLLEAGIQEKDIALEAAPDDGESYMMTNVCGELFLFVLRDGDWTSASARRALDKRLEYEVSHLVVIATGKVHEEGRVRLRDSARRHSHEGGHFEVLLIEGAERAGGELQHAFERISQKRLAAELCELDSDLGLSVGQLITTRFQLRRKPTSLKQFAASSGSGLTISLHET